MQLAMELEIFSRIANEKNFYIFIYLYTIKMELLHVNNCFKKIRYNWVFLY